MIACLAYFIPMIVSLVLINLMVFKYRTDDVSYGDYILATVVCLIPLVNIMMMFLTIYSFWKDVVVEMNLFPKMRGWADSTESWLDTRINPRKD